MNRSPGQVCSIPVTVDPVSSAKAARLRYVSDQRPGIRRIGSGKKFRYVGSDGIAVRDSDILARIRSLVIPPAWTDVWICPHPNGHLQATGRDVRGRKQSRYHPRWREVRDETKYGRILIFGQRLPQIRERVARDLARPGLPREKVLATLVRLLETTLIRVGNEEYARTNKSFGLTTMRDRHAKIAGSEVQFEFTGKSGVKHAVSIRDRRLAKLVKQCQEVPGQELFQYVDDEGNRRKVDSADVNAYLKTIAGEEFTAKDFRTWAGTVLAACALREFEKFDSATQAKKNVVAAIESVAKRLGNTKTICRKCYVHPVVVEAYLDGTLREHLERRAEKVLAQSLHDLTPEEAAVLAFLRNRLAQKSPA